MTTRKSAAIAMAITLAAGGAIAQQEKTVTETPAGTVEAGMLTCEMTGSTNLVVISDASYECVFEVAGEEFADEVYTANIQKLGVDLSIEDAETLKWAVVAATGRYDAGLIAGDYVGASADAAFGLGAGARVLVGGLDDTIALQPVSVSGREGIGIAVGVEQMSLEYQGAIEGSVAG